MATKASFVDENSENLIAMKKQHHGLSAKPLSKVQSNHQQTPTNPLKSINLNDYKKFVPEKFQSHVNELIQAIEQDPSKSGNWWNLMQFFSMRCKLDPTQMLDFCEKVCSRLTEDKSDRGYAKLHLAQCKYLTQCQRAKEAARLYKGMEMNGIGRDLYYFWIGYAQTLVKTDRKQTALSVLQKALQRQTFNEVHRHKILQTYNQMKSSPDESKNSTNELSDKIRSTPASGTSISHFSTPSQLATPSNKNLTPFLGSQTPNVNSFMEDNISTPANLILGVEPFTKPKQGQTQSKITTPANAHVDQPPKAAHNDNKSRAANFQVFSSPNTDTSQDSELEKTPETPINSNSATFDDKFSANSTPLTESTVSATVACSAVSSSPAFADSPISLPEGNSSQPKQEQASEKPPTKSNAPTKIANVDTKKPETVIKEKIQKKEKKDENPKKQEIIEKKITINQVKSSEVQALETTWQNKFSEFYVRGKKYYKLGLMGKGGSARVLKALGWIGSGESKRMEIFAIKQVDLSGQEIDEATSLSLHNEINYLASLRGKRNIVTLYDYEITPKRLSLVLEMGDIDLRQILRRSKNNPRRTNTIKVYWQQMLEAVGVIHSQRIVHADLKPANFVSFKGTLKLIDFGIAGAIQSNTTSLKRDTMVIFLFIFFSINFNIY